VKAMIAEAWARRRYKAAFVSKIDEGLGETYETQSWLDDALDAAYLSDGKFSISTTNTMPLAACSLA
jgi:four helix bundle protein